MIEVADVLAYECLALNNQRDGVLEIRSQCKDRALRRTSGNRAGGVSAGAPKNNGTKNTGANNGIVHAPRNGALANQESVRDARKLLYRLIIFISNGLARAIRAGHNQNFWRAGFK